MPLVTDLSIRGLRRQFLSGRLTPAQVIDLCHARMDTAAANIWITRLDRAQVQDYLDRLAQAEPRALPLYGIPFAIKDNIDLSGVPTTAACPSYAYTPARSAFVVECLIAAGAVPLGKTNMDQFATGLVGTRSPYGAVRNSVDPDMIAGGSSSGSAVAVARGLVSFALGTDTAGSGRVPAAFNNLVGVKPTRGLVSTRGVVPACWSLDCVSLFALDADDAGRLFDVVAVDDAADAARRGAAPLPPAWAAAPRIGVPRRTQLEFFGNTRYAACFDAAVQACRSCGADVVDIDLQPFRDAAELLYSGPWIAERLAAVGDFLREQTSDVDVTVRRIVEGGARYAAADVFRALRRLADLKLAADAVLAQVDCIVTPTAGTCYRIADIEADPIGLNTHLGWYTNFMNLLDYAAIAVPAGFTDEDFPFGVTFFAPALRDRDLLGWARRFTSPTTDLD